MSRHLIGQIQYLPTYGDDHEEVGCPWCHASSEGIIDDGLRKECQESLYEDPLRPLFTLSLMDHDDDCPIIPHLGS